MTSVFFKYIAQLFYFYFFEINFRFTLVINMRGNNFFAMIRKWLYMYIIIFCFCCKYLLNCLLYTLNHGKSSCFCHFINYRTINVKNYILLKRSYIYHRRLWKDDSFRSGTVYHSGPAIIWESDRIPLPLEKHLFNWNATFVTLTLKTLFLVSLMNSWLPFFSIIKSFFSKLFFFKKKPFGSIKCLKNDTTARQNAEKLTTSRIVLISNTRIYSDWKIEMAAHDICLILTYMIYFLGKTSSKISGLLLSHYWNENQQLTCQKKGNSVVL